jgi:uncharacterized protein (DUF433 family)/DNA-binding transcriptional MerR regulator
MAFTPAVAAALSGASTGQLAYWRSPRTSEPLLAPAHHKPRSRVSYSFRDVVALRTFVYLRSREVPLQRIRKAVASLRQLGEAEHLSEYSLIAMGRDVVWQVSADEAVDLTGSPGQGLLARMVDIFAPFANMQGQNVVDLRRPKPGISVDPDVRGGFPVVEGTRVPYDLVASLLDDGLDVTAVRDVYPSVSVEAAHGAADFARYVDGFARSRVAA